MEQSATGGAVSYGWSSQLRVEQSATGGAVSYGWSSQQREQSATGGAVGYGWGAVGYGWGAVSYGWSRQLRVEHIAMAGPDSYGWSSQLRVEKSATGGAVSYGWSSQLRVEQSATGGATTMTGMAKSQMLHSRHLASYLVYGSEGVVQAWRRDGDILNQSTHREASGRDRNTHYSITAG